MEILRYALDGSRTRDLRFRKPTLYPAELQGRIFLRFIIKTSNQPIYLQSSPKSSVGALATIALDDMMSTPVAAIELTVER